MQEEKVDISDFYLSERIKIASVYLQFDKYVSMYKRGNPRIDLQIMYVKVLK